MQYKCEKNKTMRNIITALDRPDSLLCMPLRGLLSYQNITGYQRYRASGRMVVAIR